MGPSRTLERLEVQALARVDQFLLPVPAQVPVPLHPQRQDAVSVQPGACDRRSHPQGARRDLSASPRQHGRTSHRGYVERYIRLERYPKENGDQLRSEHAPIVASHVDRALGLLPSDAIILEVERPFDFVFINSQLPDPISIESRVDLVIRHGDGIVDHIDFKTGSQSGDIIQNFISRVTVANSFEIAGESCGRSMC